MATTRITAKSSKQDVMAAYNQAIRDLKAAKAGPGAAEAGGVAAGVVDAGELGDGDISISGIVERLKALTLSIGESSSSLQSALSAEATTLHRLRGEADGYIEQLKTLHEIVVTPDTLDTLLEQYKQTSKTAEAALSEQRKRLDREVSAAQAAWKREQDEHAAKTKEAAAQLGKARQRDTQEYKYAIERQHAAETDATEQARKRFAAELAELEERKRAAWSERETSIAEREKELAELTKKSAAFEAELEAALRKAEAEGTAIARRQTKAQADLKKKDNEAIQRVLELRVQSLQEIITKQDAQLEELTRALDGARKQTTELAVKAIDGASNASSFAAIKEIALEQAKNTQKSK
jgi:hypothetical protein